MGKQDPSRECAIAKYKYGTDSGDVAIRPAEIKREQKQKLQRASSKQANDSRTTDETRIPLLLYPTHCAQLARIHAGISGQGFCLAVARC